SLSRTRSASLPECRTKTSPTLPADSSSSGLTSRSVFSKGGAAMKICLVATFPPSGRQLNEYAFHIARELGRNPDIELTILADELVDYEFATDASGAPIKASQQPELPGFNVIRCWK